jgi:hypothetical protein
VSLYAVTQDGERLKGYRSAGIDRAVFMLPTTARDEALKNLDKAAAVAREVLS